MVLAIRIHETGGPEKQLYTIKTLGNTENGEKNWSLSTLKAMCRRIDATGSAVDRQVAVDDQKACELLPTLRRLVN